MPEITIQRSTFERLQRFAKPLVDTPDTIIAKALDALDQLEGQGTSFGEGQGGSERQLDPHALPNLTHSKVLDARIGGSRVEKPNWNRVLAEVLRQAIRRAGSFEGVQVLCPANTAKGRKEDDGFSYLADVDVSVQGQPANGACHAMVAMAEACGILLDVRVMWRLKEEAAYPGERGRFKVG